MAQGAVGLCQGAGLGASPDRSPPRPRRLASSFARAASTCGFSSVMIDGSHLPYEENVALTKQVVDYAHQFDVTVEGELGVLAGVEDEVSAEHHTYTDPEGRRGFRIQAPACDSLAISIGTSHGAIQVHARAVHPQRRGHPRSARHCVSTFWPRSRRSFRASPSCCTDRRRFRRSTSKIINDARRRAAGCRRHSRRAAPQGCQERRLQDQHRLRPAVWR